MPKPEPVPNDLPDGSAWAAVLAAGVGSATLGVSVVVAEASRAVSNALVLYRPSGDLSGKSTVAVLAWAAAWVGLHLRWRKRSVRHPRWVAGLAVALVLVGLALTFPPVFDRLVPR